MMKFIFALLIISVFQASAVTRAQNVTIKVKSASFEDVFNLMHKQTDYNFIYNADMLESLPPVSVDVSNKPLNQVLDNILPGQKLSYTIQDKTVIIARMPETRPVKADITVIGTVVDDKGVTLPGVTIKVKGSDVATSTDGNGNFKITLPVGNEVLVFSFVGFKTQEVAVNNQTTLSVKMEIGVSGLEEVVVVGYGTQKKKDLTGAVSSVKGEDIAANPVSNAVEAMQGRIAGLDIQRTAGNAGAAPKILLRGNRSLNVIVGGNVVGGATQGPLYVIDGIIGDITSLNPNDIETIDVLKDASSTAIYGVAGANGVILVTTKKAKSGKIQVDVDSYYGVNGLGKYPRARTGDAWVQFMRDRYTATNNAEPPALVDAIGNAGAVTALEQGKYIDWVKETLRNGAQQNHHISVRGGTEKTQAYMSLGYIGEKGIYQGDKSSFYNVRGGVDVKFNNFFKAGLQATINLRNNDQTNSRVNKAYGTFPVGDAYDANGNINLFPIATSSVVSPIANYAPGVLVNNTKGLFAALNPYIEFKPIENLSIRSQLGVTLSSSRNGYFANENSYNLKSENRAVKEASYGTNAAYGYLWENIINYNFTLNKDHNFTVTGITAMSDQRTELSAMYGQGLDFDSYQYFNMNAIPALTSKATGYTQQNRLSVAGRVNYSYKGKYLVQLTNRWDGVSQLIKKWSAFPSGQVGWRISEESFMQSTKGWLDNLKLRAGYGVAGTANINPYVSTTNVVLPSGLNLSLGTNAALPVYIIKESLGNPNLTWERSYGTNLGLDITLFKERLDIVTEVFYNKNKGVLYPRTVPSTAGGYDAKTLYTVTSNIAETSNKGIEVTINSKNIVSKNFRWNSTLTFTRATERLDKIDLGNSLLPANLISNLLFVGEQLPQSIVYGYKKIGVWQNGEEAEAAKYGAKPGDIKLATVPRLDANGVSDNGVHAYGPNDRMVVGHTTPDFSIGLQNSFVYKAFDLSVFAVMRYGQTINAQLLGYYNSIAPPEFYNYWTPSNPSNDYPRAYNGGTNASVNTNFQSALSIVDGSYFKIKNITLGYTLPAKIANKIGFSRLRAYGTAYNTFIYAKSKLLKDIDPETEGSDSFPLYKQMVFGINASF